ncbi:ubiquitin C-terminal hydrolase [Copromyces sp. CBS 386.78]|nr:ubiquitin C-terminal hydrolase [Copromyces sp. CBS 386.78]
MNSDTRRIQNHHPPRSHPKNYYHAYPADRQLRDYITSPTIIISVILLFLSALYQLLFSDQHTRTRLKNIIWARVVDIIPATLLFKVDGFLNPPLFPNPMTPAEIDTSHEAKSQALGRILGLDKPGGVMESVTSAGLKGLSTLSSVGWSFNNNTSDRPAGLGNNDNSCYQNSILQGLASLQGLPEYLARVSQMDSNTKSTMPTTQAMAGLIATLNDKANYGRCVWPPGVLKNMSTWQQQDAQEYFSKLLDQIDREVAKATATYRKSLAFDRDLLQDDGASSHHSDDSGYHSSSQTSSVSDVQQTKNPLEGLMAQRVVCVKCKHFEGLTLIPFNCLTLNLGSGQLGYDLYERLDYNARVEFIEGVHCPKCSLLKMQQKIKGLIVMPMVANDEARVSEFRERLAAVEEALEEDMFDDKTLAEKCKVPAKQRVESTKTKQTAISQPPKSLVIHINRSVFDERTGYMYKDSSAVRFPSMLDLGPWCLGSAKKRADLEGANGILPSSTSNGDQSAEDEEKWNVEPTVSMVAGSQRPSTLTGPIYELRAVITHQGRHDSGHYVCYRKHYISPPEKENQPEVPPPQLVAEDEADAPDAQAPDQKPIIETMATVEEGAPSAASEDEEKTLVSDAEEEATSQWWRLSDTDVFKVDEESVLERGDVFMLFYECVEPEMARIPEREPTRTLSPQAELASHVDDQSESVMLVGSEKPEDVEMVKAEAPKAVKDDTTPNGTVTGELPETKVQQADPATASESMEQVD